MMKILGGVLILIGIDLFALGLTLWMFDVMWLEDFFEGGRFFFGEWFFLLASCFTLGIGVHLLRKTPK